MKNKFSYILMYAAFFIYSFTGILSKLASAHEFLTVEYLLCIFGIILTLGIYAILWQQVLKRLPLSLAMANKPIILVVNIVWASLLFKEVLTTRIVFGILLIIVGIIIIGLKHDA